MFLPPARGEKASGLREHLYELMKDRSRAGGRMSTRTTVMSDRASLRDLGTPAGGKDKNSDRSWRRGQPPWRGARRGLLCKRSPQNSCLQKPEMKLQVKDVAPRCRVRFAKCQLLATCFFALLLSLSMGMLTILTRFGDRFVILHTISPGNNPYGLMYRWAFSLGIFLTFMLALGVLLSTVAVVREAKGIMAGGFLSFTLVFFVAVQVTFWRYWEPSKVENTVLDTYDLAYEQAMRNASDVWRQKLVAIHDTFGCCGKSSPLSWLGQEEKDLCGADQQREGCLQEIRSFVREYLRFVSLLLGITLAFVVYGMFLTSFLWLTIHHGRNLARRGQYTLTPQ
ncbi:LOW QUALITY PROTEIN: tetraspanin-32 [Dromiciops gliroides]|uniref:LOW QUALITY PROTEIN: tetraspanin-32 n=1 Tax=Dromiciops gliroides TaxID=33562 RepID=UPI001CC5C072|nr:LOW QUALITY PROTEIN: tetraspanin-32 [Dromiciops gliroides]